MTRRRAALLALIPAVLDPCRPRRRYDQGGILRNPDTTYTFYVRPTVFDLPIPMPEVSPIPGVADWGGCPLQVVLERRDDVVVYAFIQGGP